MLNTPNPNTKPVLTKCFNSNVCFVYQHISILCVTGSLHYYYYYCRRKCVCVGSIHNIIALDPLISFFFMSTKVLSFVWSFVIEEHFPLWLIFSWTGRYEKFIRVSLVRRGWRQLVYCYKGKTELIDTCKLTKVPSNTVSRDLPSDNSDWRKLSQRSGTDCERC